MDVNATDEDGRTPLHNAIDNNRMEIAELLIARGTNINAKDEYGLVPLHDAAY